MPTNRNHAISAENNAMDELARLSREIAVIELLVLRHRQEPALLSDLALVLRRLRAERAHLQRLRAAVAEHI